MIKVSDILTIHALGMGMLVACSALLCLIVNA